MGEKCVIGRYGEMGVKSDFTLHSFMKKLLRNIEDALNENNIEFEKIYSPKGRIVVYTEENKLASNCMKRVFGLNSVSPAIKVNSDLEKIKEVSLEIFNDYSGSSSKFRITTNRSSDKIDLTSMEISDEVGDYVRNFGNGEPVVDLEDYDIEINIEVFGDYAYVFSKTLDCYGGLPIGSQGRVLSLISGKRSSLATWLMMKRGCEIYPVHFDLNDVHRNVEDWFGVLDRYAYGFDFNPDYISFQRELNDIKATVNEFKKKSFFEPLFQAKIVRKVQEIVEQKNCQGIVLGNTLKSETDMKIINIHKKVTRYPIFYPIIAGWDEIVNQIPEELL